MIPRASERKCLPGESCLHNGTSLPFGEGGSPGWPGLNSRVLPTVCQHVVGVVEVLVPTLNFSSVFKRTDNSTVANQKLYVMCFIYIYPCVSV